MAAVDDALSRALIVFTQRGNANSPRADGAAVVAEFGSERGPALLADVTEIFREADSLAPGLPPLPLPEATRQVKQVMAQRHPELSEEAIAALGWKWSFDWR